MAPLKLTILNPMQTRFRFAAAFATCTLYAVGTAAHAAPPPATLDDARAALEKSSALVIDIREASEHATGVASGARLIPMSQLAKRLSELPKPGGQAVLIICNTQNRSANIVAQLHAAGFTNANYVYGGMSQWAARGWPMVKPEAPPPPKP